MKILKGSLRKKLTVSFSVVIIISILISSISLFFITRYNVQNDFEKYSNQIANQTKNYVEVMATTVDTMHSQFYCNDDFMKLTASKPDADERVMEERRKKITNEIMNIAISNSFNLISGITFYSPNGLSASFPSKTYTTEQSNEIMENVKKENWYDKVIERDGKPLWIPPHEEKVVEGKNDTYLSSISVLKDEDNNFLGILKINININNINEIVRESKIGDNGFLFIIDQDKNIIAHKDKSLVGTQIDQSLLDKITGKSAVFDFSYDNTQMEGISLDSDYTDWKYVAAVPKSDLLKTAYKIQKTCFIIAILCVIICFLIGQKLSQEIRKPIDKLIDLTKVVSHGMLNVKSEESGITEIDELGKNFDKMVSDLRNILLSTDELSNQSSEFSEKLSDITEDVTSSSDEIALAMKDITCECTRQADSTSECLNISQDLSYNINTAVGYIDSVFNQAEKSMRIVSNSKEIVDDLSNNSKSNLDVIIKLNDTVNNLKEKTENIREILEKINEVSENTNLLALNASIESSRAGEAGKGFSVVADEIRKLSLESSKASQSISEILSEIKNSIDSTTKITNVAKNEFEKEVDKVSDTVNSFSEIEKVISNSLTSMVMAKDNIERISKQKDKLVNNMSEISEASEKNAAASEEVLGSVDVQADSYIIMNDIVQKLNDKSSELQEKMKIFELNK